MMANDRGMSAFLLGCAALVCCAPAVCSQNAGNDKPMGGLRHLEASVTDSASVHQFVQGFYDWYVPAKAMKEDPRWSMLTKNPYLTPSLASALRGDSAASREKPQNREILNFDPFLMSQDPCSRYVVAQVSRQSDRYRVLIRPDCGGGTPVVDVVSLGGRWVIANVWYPETPSPNDLLSILCQFAIGDNRPERRPSRCPITGDKPPG